MAFDTYAFAKKLHEAGFTQEQVEVLVEGLRGLLEENLATKSDLDQARGSLQHDIKVVYAELKRDIEETRSALTRDIEAVRADLEHKIQIARRDTIIWLGSIIVVALTAQSILMKLL